MERKVVLITGANRGMGWGLAEALAERGATVLMVCRREEPGRRAAQELCDRGLDARLFVADVEKTVDIERVREEVSRQFDRLDALVNNAAVALEASDLTVETMPLDVFERTMAVNFRGPVWMCKAFIPLLRRSDSGRIINYSSGLGRLTVPRMGQHPAYSMSKAAINALTKVLAHELRDTKILVNSVDPGWVRTDMGGPSATLTVQEGVDTAFWLATADASQIENGCLYRRRQVLSW
jgi:NAD(P)-dependent dehydrogenase (short-subunit alcohol dehydrogenase family)